MKKLIVCSLFLMAYFATSIQAAIIIQNGKILNADDVATMSAEEHYAAGLKAMEVLEWAEAAKNFHIVVTNFPLCSFTADALYYYGISSFNLEEYEFANGAFGDYLKNYSNPEHFLDAFNFKFAIAEKFKCGAKRRVLGWKSMPKWVSAEKNALEIYDEITAALPFHELAVKSLYSKSDLLRIMRDYRQSIDSLQTLIKRFPKHDLAPASYLLISEIYLEQSRLEFQNPDLLIMSQISLKDFKRDFPGEERLAYAESNVLRIREIYANGLFETGQFYERICKPCAAIIYYRNAMSRFPDTVVAENCRCRLEYLER